MTLKKQQNHFNALVGFRGSKNKRGKKPNAFKLG